jgi:hypothetical protein
LIAAVGAVIGRFIIWTGSSPYYGLLNTNCPTLILLLSALLCFRRFAKMPLNPF